MMRIGFLAVTARTNSLAGPGMTRFLAKTVQIV
jgi:hypothetical protein